MTNEWRSTWILEDIPKILERARFFENVPEAERVQVAAAEVCRASPERINRVIKKGTLDLYQQENESEKFFFYSWIVQSNPSSERTFDTFRLIICTPATEAYSVKRSPQQLQDARNALLAVERIAKGMYGIYACDGILVSVSSCVASHTTQEKEEYISTELKFLVHRQIVYRWYPSVKKAKLQTPPIKITSTYYDKRA